VKVRGEGGGEPVGSLTEAAMKVGKYLGEVGEAGADEIRYYCELSGEEFSRVKRMLGLARRWTVEGGRTKPLYSLAQGSIWHGVFYRAPGQE